MDMTSFKKIFIEQVMAHPSMEPQDAVKLCFQAVFGAEHLLTHESCARQYFMDEFKQTAALDSPLFEAVSSDYCRGNLAAWKHWELPPEWLFRMFFHTATMKGPENPTAFDLCLDAVGSLAESGSLPFVPEEWTAFRQTYEAGEKGPVHHSNGYRENEHPAYRIVRSDYIRLLPVLLKINLLPQNETVKVIAIDGRAAAGKTTIAALLSHVLEAEAIHMDDFFLPRKLRTPARLSEPGGNVHYERFISEVLPKLKNPDPFTYRRFDCAHMAYGESRQVGKSQVRIVEGSYSCHPAFGSYMDLRVFCDVSAKEQLRRIAQRNGDEMAALFATRWIPMEEKYFSAEHVKKKADVVLQSL